MTCWMLLYASIWQKTPSSSQCISSLFNILTFFHHVSLIRKEKTRPTLTSIFYCLLLQLSLTFSTLCSSLSVCPSVCLPACLLPVCLLGWTFIGRKMQVQQKNPSPSTQLPRAAPRPVAWSWTSCRRRPTRPRRESCASVHTHTHTHTHKHS